MFDAFVGPMIPSSHRCAARRNFAIAEAAKSFVLMSVISGIKMEELLRMRLLTVILPFFVVTAVAVAGYFYWLYEEPRATGPLAEALLARVELDEGEQALDEVANAFFGDQAPIAERRTILETNGFDCVISPANVAGNEILSCRRPIDGRHYCDRFNFHAYQTVAGEIVESLVSTYRVSQRDRMFGRCPYSTPRADG